MRTRKCPSCARRVEIGSLCAQCVAKDRIAEYKADRKLKMTRAGVDAAVDSLPEDRAAIVRRWFGYRPGLVDAARLPSVRSRCGFYGITVGGWLYMVAKQQSACAICRTEYPPNKLAIDHDHETGHVRGLLCPPCNMGLGHLRIDGMGSIERAESVLAYVKSHRSVTSGYRDSPAVARCIGAG